MMILERHVVRISSPRESMAGGGGGATCTCARYLCRCSGRRWVLSEHVHAACACFTPACRRNNVKAQKPGPKAEPSDVAWSSPR
eukprot:4070991-Prymnesium_polylepis.2